VRPTHLTRNVVEDVALVHHVERGRTSGKPRERDAIACRVPNSLEEIVPMTTMCDARMRGVG
jgi:hypothetical protein